MAVNINGLMLKSTIGLGTAMFIGVQTFMGSTIKENRETNVKEHNKIIETMIARDEKIMENIHKFDVRQEVLIKSVARIERKL